MLETEVKHKPILNYRKAPVFPGLFGKLVKLMAMKKNVLLIGGHGVGKTGMALSAAEALYLKCKYLSAATMDPYADFAGIPIPDRKKKIIEFFHDADLDRYHIFFVDELNRPAHLKILNGVLELIQFHSVQGRPFKKLKMVWAAMNPPNAEYNVDDIDPALLDRFHHYIEIPNVFIQEFYINKFGKDIGKVLLNWGNSLSQDKRKAITPRRLEYIGTIINDTRNSLDLVSTSVMPGIGIEERDIKLLVAQMAPFFGGKEINDSSSKLSDKLKDQNNVNKEDIDHAVSQIRRDTKNNLRTITDDDFDTPQTKDHEWEM
jgi:hypothetical protein